jgi:peptidoglycan hydrolase-like protein with peptidoglycan-binding domain
MQPAAAEPAVQTASVQQPMPPLPQASAAPGTEAAAAPVAAEPAPVVVADTAPVVVVDAAAPDEPMTDRELVAKVQRGLSSLGFLRGEVDGVVGEATAKAIRNFEVYYNYEVTGRVSPALVDLLVAAGAQI